MKELWDVYAPMRNQRINGTLLKLFSKLSINSTVFIDNGYIAIL